MNEYLAILIFMLSRKLLDANWFVNMRSLYVITVKNLTLVFLRE